MPISTGHLVLHYFFSWLLRNILSFTTITLHHNTNNNDNKKGHVLETRELLLHRCQTSTQEGVLLPRGWWACTPVFPCLHPVKDLSRVYLCKILPVESCADTHNLTKPLASHLLPDTSTQIYWPVSVLLLCMTQIWKKRKHTTLHYKQTNQTGRWSTTKFNNAECFSLHLNSNAILNICHTWCFFLSFRVGYWKSDIKGEKMLQ